VDSESCPSDFNACAAALCQENTICEEDEDGNAVCIPIDPCSVVRCGNGPCEVVDGKAVCTDDPCVNMECDDGEVCVVNDGNAECIENPCKWAKCSAGFKCQPNSDGTSTSCVPTTCKYNDQTYEDGESFDSIDGCNTCYCEYGEISCTKMACVPDDDGQTECKTDSDCDEGYICDYYSCAEEDGYCTQQFDMCAMNWDPVCGCDGQTYSSDCERINAGVTLRLYRECPVCDPPCADGESLCCAGCQNTSFCSTGSLTECPLMKCAAPLECDPPCVEGESLCCAGCQNTSFCSTGSLTECPLMKCAA